MMPALPTWLWTQEALMTASAIALTLACVWFWHWRLGHLPRPGDLAPMSGGWLTQKHLHEHEPR